MENNFYAKYVQCSRMTNQSQNIWFAEPTISKCLKHCHYLNYTLTASSNVCSCHNTTIGTIVNESACNLENSHDKHFYGINNFSSFYQYNGKLKIKNIITWIFIFSKEIPKPDMNIILNYTIEYVGCLAINFHDVLWDKSISNEECFEFCARLNYSVVGIRKS